MKDSTVIPISECLTCHYKMDRTVPAYNSGRRIPIKGDLCVCAKCATPSQFDDKLNMVPLTERDLEELKRDELESYTALRKLQIVINERNKTN